MAQNILNERFKGPALDGRLQWLNPPLAWSMEPAGLVVRPAAETDFWQQTHYGFRADNGHFLYLEVAGDFSVTTKVRFQPAHLYDQAGLMVRVRPSCWIKTSVEYESKGPSKLGAVVTNLGYSDWSLQDFPRRQKQVQLRIRRAARDFLVEWKGGEGKDWQLLRVAHLHEGADRRMQCGLYVCSPKGSGFRADFGFLRIDHL
jgi:regulation of enolase protein 1 (concanavalin A-like superfamily)